VEEEDDRGRTSAGRVRSSSTPTVDGDTRKQVWRALLQDERVNVSICNNKGETMLHQVGHDAELVHLLCNRDPNLVHVVNHHGETPLCTASGGPLDDAVVQALLEHHAAPLHVNPVHGWNPLHRAVQGARFQQVQAILTTMDKNTHHHNHHHSDVLSLLLNAKEHRQGRTPLMMACHEYWKDGTIGAELMQDICITLLRHPALDVNVRDHDGRTILHHASARGLTWFVAAVLQHGHHQNVQIEARDQYGQTAAHLACQYNHVQIVQLLIQQGACLVTPRDQHGHTPLYHAIWKEDQCTDLLYYLMREHKAWLQFHTSTTTVLDLVCREWKKRPAYFRSKSF
jgi:ankyrin repeat protein